MMMFSGGFLQDLVSGMDWEMQQFTKVSLINRALRCFVVLIQLKDTKVPVPT